MAENEAMRIYHSLLEKYIDPLLRFCDIYIDQNGLLIDRATGGALRYSNDKYREGDMDKSPVIFLAVAINEEHFLRIKEDPSMDLFNPFSIPRHALILAIKVKRALNPYFLSEESLELSDQEQDELIQLLQSARDENGNYSMEFMNYENPENPVTLYKFISTEDNQCKMAIGLCGLAYNNHEKKPKKEFIDFEKSWKTISNKIELFNKERKKIKAFVKEEINNTYDISQMDLSGGKEVESITLAYESKIYDEDDYVQDEDMDAFLTALCNGEDLIPVIDDLPEFDDIATKENMLQNVGEIENDVMIQQAIDEESIENDTYTVSNEINSEESNQETRSGGFSFGTSQQSFQQFGILPQQNMMQYGNTIPMQQNIMQFGIPMQQFNMSMNPLGVQNTSIETMDLSGGESPNPFQMYQ